MLKLYDLLADWWPLFSPPADYADEAEYFLPLIEQHLAGRSGMLLELGSGGGNNAIHFKRAFSAVTLVDLAPHMLEVSRALNPDCEHIEGDMRSVRLGRSFDVVFIHDAIDYLTTLDDLQRAFETAYLHCAPGGLALFAPDHVAETFQDYTEHGGTDGVGRALRYLEWTYDPNPEDSLTTTHFVLVLREGDGPPTIVHDQHDYGLFPRADWLRLLTAVGFTPSWQIDPFGRCIFLAHKP